MTITVTLEGFELLDVALFFILIMFIITMFIIFFWIFVCMQKEAQIETLTYHPPNRAYTKRPPPTQNLRNLNNIYYNTRSTMCDIPIIEV